MYEAELVRLYDEVFHKLGIRVSIRVNHRRLLAGLANVCGLGDRFQTLTVAIDKADKIGWSGVREDLVRQGIAEEAAHRAVALLEQGDLEALRPQLSADPEGAQGLAEMDTVLGYLAGSPLHNRLDLDLSLARGLSYYTGCIFEVKALDYEMGSIGGGGRYADLTGIFGLKGLSGVGISFGADRIYDVMEGLELFPEQAVKGLQALVMVMDQQDHGHAFELLGRLRAAGIAADLYPEAAKVQKMMKYANAIGAAHVILIGESERQSGRPTWRNMADGTQQSLDVEEIISRLRPL